MWLSVLGALALCAGCAAQTGGGSLAVGSDDYPQAPMVVRPAEGGGYALHVCATGEASGERGTWIESVTITDITLDPPVVVWEVVLPDSRRDKAWSWGANKPWVVKIGKAPPDFEESVPLKKELPKDVLYQVSVIGWDPGELLFAIEQNGSITHYDPVTTRKIGTPRLPCEQPPPA